MSRSSQMALPRGLPLFKKPDTIFSWSCRRDIQKPRLPYEISSFVIFRLKIKSPGTPVAAIGAAIET